MLKNSVKCLVILFIGICSSTVFSDENSSIFTTDNNIISFLSSSFVTTLSVGPAWGNAGNSQTLTLAPDVEKTYTADHIQNAIADYDFFLGIQKPLTAKLLSQIGLDIATTGDAILSGDIWDDSDPAFDNYTYQYRIKHSQIALKGKLLGNFDWPVIPWISATLGAGFNRSYSFTNTPLIYQAVQSPNFSSQIITAFTYAVGVGLQRVFTKNWQAGVGYEFADWGRSRLSSATGSTTNQSLSLSHLYTCSVMFNITYLA